MLNGGENERVALLEDILDKIETIEDTATEVAAYSFVISVVYVLIFCCKSEIKTCIIEMGTSIPLFILFSTIFVEIKDRAMLTKSKIKKLEREARREARREAQSEALAQGMMIAQEKHKEWVEWADNGREEDKKPLPPKVPNNQ